MNILNLYNIYVDSVMKTRNVSVHTRSVPRHLILILINYSSTKLRIKSYYKNINL